MLFGGWEHCERQEQQGEQDQGVCWHEDVSLQLKFSLTRMWCAVVMVVDMRVFYTFNMGDNIRVNCIGGWRHCGWQRHLDRGDHGGRWHHDVSLQLESLVINRPLLATFSSYSTFMMSWTLVLSNTLKLSNTEMHSPSALLIKSWSSLKNILRTPSIARKVMKISHFNQTNQHILSILR